MLADLDFQFFVFDILLLNFFDKGFDVRLFVVAKIIRNGDGGGAY